MPRKVALSLQYRILIYSRLKAGFSARQIFELVFGAAFAEIRKSSIRRWWCNCQRIYLRTKEKETGRTSLIEPGELLILAEFVALDSTRILQIMKRDFIHYFFIQKMSWDQGHFRQPQLFVPLDSQHGRYLKATYLLLIDINNGFNTNIFVISVMMVQIICLTNTFQPF